KQFKAGLIENGLIEPITEGRGLISVRQELAAGIEKAPAVPVLPNRRKPSSLLKNLARTRANCFTFSITNQWQQGCVSHLRIMGSCFRTFRLRRDELVWNPTVFTKNRDRLQSGEVFVKFMTKLLNHPQVKPLLSDEHFSVDGTLIEAWASQKSFRPKDGSGD